MGTHIPAALQPIHLHGDQHHHQEKPSSAYTVFLNYLDVMLHDDKWPSSPSPLAGRGRPCAAMLSSGFVKSPLLSWRHGWDLWSHQACLSCSFSFVSPIRVSSVMPHSYTPSLMSLWRPTPVDHVLQTAITRMPAIIEDDKLSTHWLRKPCPPPSLDLTLVLDHKFFAELRLLEVPSVVMGTCLGTLVSPAVVWCKGVLCVEAYVSCAREWYSIFRPHCGTTGTTTTKAWKGTCCNTYLPFLSRVRRERRGQLPQRWTRQQPHPQALLGGSPVEAGQRSASGDTSEHINVLMARLTSKATPLPNSTPFSLYGSRHKWLDSLPPFDDSSNKPAQVTLQDLMQLQVLLASGHVTTNHAHQCPEAGLPRLFTLRLLTYPLTGCRAGVGALSCPHCGLLPHLFQSRPVLVTQVASASQSMWCERFVMLEAPPLV